MAITSCQECNGKVSTLAASCPHCGTPVVQGSPPAKVPPPVSTIQMKCPNCSFDHEYPLNAAGRKGRCSRCGTAYRIPAAGEVAVPIAAPAVASAASARPAQPPLALPPPPPPRPEPAIGSDSTVRTKALSASRAVFDRAKMATTDTAAVLSGLLKNPTNGLAEAFEKLGPAKSLQVGVVCGLIFDGSVLLCLVQLIRAMVGGFGEGVRGHSPDLRMPSLPLDAYIKGGMAAAIPLVSIALSMTLTRSLCRGKGSFAGDIFVAGIALLPFAFAFLAFSVLGVANIEVVLVLLLVAECFLVLTLFHGFKDLGGLSPGFAAFAVPAAIIGSAYLVKVLGSALISVRGLTE